MRLKFRIPKYCAVCRGDIEGECDDKDIWNTIYFLGRCNSCGILVGGFGVLASFITTPVATINHKKPKFKYFKEVERGNSNVINIEHRFRHPSS